MKSQLIAIVAAVLLAGCGPSVGIHQAAEDGNLEAVKQHLAAGKDVNAPDESGWTPLHYADNKEIAVLLITSGADVNDADDGGATPLHKAAFQGYTEIAELLIANGADVNAKNKHGGTPLLYAALEGRKEIVELLIAKGGDVNVKDDGGRTPLDYANTFNRTELRVRSEIAHLLREHGGKFSKDWKAEGK